MADSDWAVATQQLSGRGAALRLTCPRVAVEILAGPHENEVHQLVGMELRIGSADGNDLVLRDGAISRHHVTLRLEPGGVRVLDAGSRNGTRVDGVLIRDAFLAPTSVVELGRTRFRLRLDQTTVDVPLSERESFGRLLGRSAPMRRLFAILERAAPTQATVLIGGETGTGKELVAEAIHEASPRAGEAFVVFDCSAVAATLIESELFGHVRGSFTGAVADHVGVFEAADGGTLFLDEIGELPLELQPKLLRALEQREVRRVGGRAAKKVDVRVIAATHRSLNAEVEAGRFREDLFYRLAVVHVDVPPLRDRLDDIPLLARHFARAIGGELSEAQVRTFGGMAWPGNVRALRNAVERTLALGEELANAAPEPRGTPELAVDLRVPLREARDRLCEAFEQRYLEKALAAAGGNVSRAAEIAGVNRKFIQRAAARRRDDP